MSEPMKIRTLIAEDEESFRGVLTNVLQASERFSVVSVENGEEAIEALKGPSFDLVILDHKLPGMSGLNILQWMHEQKLETPVIVLTGAGSENIATEMMKLGAYDYIRKEDFDKQHFPIIAAGVYERYLFRKEKDRREEEEVKRRKDIVSLEYLDKSISSLIETVNSALTTVMLASEEALTLLHQLPRSESIEKLKKYAEEIKRDHEIIATVNKSIVDMTRLMFERYARARASEYSEKDTAERASSSTTGPQGHTKHRPK
jgi:CheY-like chemotaxis protein